MFERFKNGVSKLNSNIVQFFNNYLVNDPSTPELKMKIKIPAMSDLKYSVQDLNFNPTNSNQTRSLNCYVSLGNCLNNVQKHLKTPIRKWPGASILQVFPNAGVDLNAYYDRRSLRFFYYTYKGKTIYFADSSDIVTHELGHAILDAMRPDFWSVASLEIWSFHEAFSDIVALFNMMSYDIVTINTFKQTKNNFAISNNITRLAEEVGVLIRNLTRDSAYLSNALRDPAVEKYKYVNPKTLPKQAPNNKLAAECHSFGRVFSGAWYEMFVRIYAHHISQKLTPIQAFNLSRDICFSTLLQAIPTAPRVSNFYEAIARSMLVVANSKGKVYSNIMQQVFLEWNILSSSSFKMLSNTSYKSLVYSLKKEDLVFKNSKSTMFCIKNSKTLKISDLPMVSSLSTDQNVEIEIPGDEYYEFDKDGNLIYEIRESDLDSKESTVKSLESISEDIGKDKMWHIEGGKLIRKFIS